MPRRGLEDRATRSQCVMARDNSSFCRDMLIHSCVDRVVMVEEPENN